MVKETAKRTPGITSQGVAQMIARQERRTLLAAARHVARVYRNQAAWEDELKTLVRIANAERAIDSDEYASDAQWSELVALIVDVFLAVPKHAERFAGDLAFPAFKKALKAYMQIKWYDDIRPKGRLFRIVSVSAKRDLNAV